MKIPKVITECVCPPIPIRTFDWRAFYDGDEEYGRCGYGKTEQQAIDDLTENYHTPVYDEDRQCPIRSDDQRTGCEETVGEDCLCPVHGNVAAALNRFDETGYGTIESYHREEQRRHNTLPDSRPR